VQMQLQQLGTEGMVPPALFQLMQQPGQATDQMLVTLAAPLMVPSTTSVPLAEPKLQTGSY